MATSVNNLNSDFQQQKKTLKSVPRVTLLGGNFYQKPIHGVSLLWPDWSETSIWDLSLNGICICREGFIAQKLKTLVQNHQLEVKLKVKKTDERMNLNLSLLRLDSGMIQAAFAGTLLDSRLKIEQTIKDELVSLNLRSVSAGSLLPDFYQGRWFHGPFDTNFFLSEKLNIFEYDNLLVRITSEQMDISKSQSVVEPSQNYSQIWKTPLPQKVSLGVSWLARLEKLVHALAIPEKDQLLQALSPLRGS
jgi:hypothetical protein